MYIILCIHHAVAPPIARLDVIRVTLAELGLSMRLGLILALDRRLEHTALGSSAVHQSAGPLDSDDPSEESFGPLGAGVRIRNQGPV